MSEANLAGGWGRQEGLSQFDLKRFISHRIVPERMTPTTRGEDEESRQADGQDDEDGDEVVACLSKF